VYKQPIPAQRIQLLTINMPILAGQECILKPPNNHWQASLNPSTLTQLLSIKKLRNISNEMKVTDRYNDCVH